MEVENGESQSWRFNQKDKDKVKKVREKERMMTVRDAAKMLKDNIDPCDQRPLVDICRGDPTPFLSFQPDAATAEVVARAVCSGRFNGYCPPGSGSLPARKAISEYISSDLPYKLSPDDVYLTVGCKQAIEAIIAAVAHLGGNILIPKPGFTMYDAASSYLGVELRPYNLLPEKGWEIDLDSLEVLVDDNTLAMVVINPGNPCGTVYTHQHLQQVADYARKLGLFVIADEVYEHIVFGSNPFVRMGVFASKVPVITLGSMSKRWLIPGWRIGWLVTTDPNGILQKSKLLERIQAFLRVAAEPPTFIQAAVPEIIDKTKTEFFSKVLNVLRQDADIIFDELKQISCITCPKKPEGSMFVMVKLNVLLMDGIQDDMDFCLKLAKEEKVIVLPGSTLNMTNWLRISFAVEPPALADGLKRMKAFCRRNAKQ